MHQYLQDTEYATKNLFLLATDEQNQLTALLAKLTDAEARLRVHQWDFQTSDLNDDFSDAYVMAAFARAGNAAKETAQLHQQVASLQASVGTHQHAVQAVCGSILQIAKQGISLVHGNRLAALPGRTIGSLVVRDVIWHARNQSMHYEEGIPNNKETRQAFETLAAEHGQHFSLSQASPHSKAKHVLDLLGWQDYAAYLADMQALLPSEA